MPEDKYPGSACQAVLTLASPDGRVIEVRDGDVVGRTAVGRDVLDIHEEISRRHAQFVLNDGKWYVIDLKSSNGTFLEGALIPPNELVQIRNGQTIMLSSVFQAEVKIDEAGNEKGCLPSAEGREEYQQGARRTMVILFADLKGSVDFFQEKGTIVARDWLLTLYRMLSSIVSSHGGIHIKNIGDAILAVFDNPHGAAKAALDMQADLKEHNARAGETGQYHLRIGMNMGAVLFEGNDVFGNAVNIASRVQAFAPPECIYITQRLYDEVGDSTDIHARFVGYEQLKGVREKTGIYEILCDSGKGGHSAGDIL